MIRSAAPVLLLSLLAGCAGETRRYPSLAPRAAEQRGFAEPVAAPAIVTPDPALDARLATQAAELDRIAAGFTAAADAGRRDAAKAVHQPVGSDAWLTAQAALARLDDWRARASALTAEIEAAGSARAAALLPPYPAVEALRDRVAIEAEREATVTGQLQASLPAA